jgi:hypothetical protein
MDQPLVASSGKKKTVTKKREPKAKNVTEKVKKPTAKSLKILEKRRTCIQKFRERLQEPVFLHLWTFKTPIFSNIYI